MQAPPSGAYTKNILGLLESYEDFDGVLVERIFKLLEEYNCYCYSRATQK